MKKIKVCTMLRKEVERSEKFKDSPKVSYTVVGGYLFLRFICPAMVSPFANGVYQTQPSTEMTSALISISKVIQNLANEITVCKEEYMKPMMSFVTKNLQTFEEFVDKITVRKYFFLFFLFFIFFF